MVRIFRLIIYLTILVTVCTVIGCGGNSAKHRARQCLQSAAEKVGFELRDTVLEFHDDFEDCGKLKSKVNFVLQKDSSLFFVTFYEFNNADNNTENSCINYDRSWGGIYTLIVGGAYFVFRNHDKSELIDSIFGQTFHGMNKHIFNCYKN